jgi:hypothetical protein
VDLTSRVLVWFSCGAASATAAWLALDTYGAARVRVIYCDTLRTEHPDNVRFLRDVEKWLGVPVEIIRSEDYRDVDDVFERTRYMSGIAGARCTVEMKKVPRFKYQRPDDIHVFGLTEDEPKRIRDLEQNNPELFLTWVLRDRGYKKADCLAAVKAAGIALPAMYALGFDHNNCIGCVKATSPAYWDLTRKHFPEAFARRASQSRDIGARLVRYHGKRIFLDELPERITDKRAQEDIECGPVCVAVATQEFEPGAEPGREP